MSIEQAVFTAHHRLARVRSASGIASCGHRRRHRCHPIVRASNFLLRQCVAEVSGWISTGLPTEAVDNRSRSSRTHAHRGSRSKSLRLVASGPTDIEPALRAAPCRLADGARLRRRVCGSSIALRMMIMKLFLAVSRRHGFWLAASLALFFSAFSGAEAACPNWVETTSGSVFNIAALIADAGSAQFALERVKRALSKVDAGGGCAIFSDRPACDETMTLAKKAITALEACTTPAVSNDDGRRLVQ